MTGAGGGEAPEPRSIVAVIPALDEEATVGEVVGALVARGLGVIVVDGGSRDGTAAAAAAAGAEVVVERRRGYGRAVRTGAAAARGEILVFLDAGGQQDPADLGALLAPIEAGEADLVLGSRARGASEAGATRPWQRLGNRLVLALLRRRTGLDLSDLGPFRAIRAADFAALPLVEDASSWPVEVPLRAARAGLRVVEVPVSARRRAGGRSKVSGTLRGSLRAAADLLRVVATG